MLARVHPVMVANHVAVLDSQSHLFCSRKLRVALERGAILTLCIMYNDSFCGTLGKIRNIGGRGLPFVSGIDFRFACSRRTSKRSDGFPRYKMFLSLCNRDDYLVCLLAELRRSAQSEHFAL